MKHLSENKHFTQEFLYVHSSNSILSKSLSNSHLTIGADRSIYII